MAKALSFICGTPERQELLRLLEFAKSRAWTGRGGALDATVYQALVGIAFSVGVNVNVSEDSESDGGHSEMPRQLGNSEFYASIRDIAESSGASLRGIRNSLRRLQSDKLVARSGVGDDNTRVTAWQLGGGQ